MKAVARGTGSFFNAAMPARKGKLKNDEYNAHRDAQAAANKQQMKYKIG